MTSGPHRPHQLAGHPDIQAQVELALPSGQPLPRRGLEHLQLLLVVRRAQMLDIGHPAPGAMHDLHRLRPRRGPHRAHVRHQRVN
jgi:hypothetical protein